MDALDRLCTAIARRRRLERALARTLPAAGVAALTGATAVAVIRLAAPEAAWLVPGVIAAAMLTPVAWLPAALARRDPAWRIAAEADHLCRADGLAMAVATAGPGAAGWIDRLAPQVQAARLPPLRAPGLLPALLALALLTGAWFLPQASTPTPSPVAAVALGPLERGLAEAEEERLAPPDVLDALQQRLEAIREAMATAGMDQRTWAALDTLERDLAASRAAALDRLADALAKTEALAALAPDSPELARAAAEAAVALAELAQQAPGLSPEALARADAAELLNLAREAIDGGELTDEQLAALRRWGADPAQLPADGAQGDPAAAQQLAQRLADGLAQRLAEAGGEREAGACPSGAPGTEGGGPAELTWGDGERIPGGFRDRLAPGTPQDPRAGALLGTRSRAPEAHEQGEATARAELAGHAATPDANTVRIAPRHRAAVGGYFAAPP